MTAVVVKPFVAVLSHVPLVTGAIVDALEGIAEVRAFTTQNGDTVGLLRSLRPDAIVVDGPDAAESAAKYARAADVPLLYVSLRERKLRVLESDGWRDEAGRPSSEFVAKRAGRGDLPEGAGMTVTEPLVPYLDLPVDERTRDLLERRSRSSVVHRGWLVRRALLAADLVGLTAALLIAEFVLPIGGVKVGTVNQWLEVSLFVLSLPVWVVMAKLYGLYDRDEERTDHSTADDFVDVFHMVTVGTWVVYVVLRLSGLANPALAKVATFWIVAVGLVAATRAVARAYCRRQVAYLQNTVIVGAGDVGQTVARKFLNHPEYGINLVGFVDDEPKERREDLDDLTILGGPSDLREIVKVLDVDRVVFAFSNEPHTATVDLIRSLKDLDVQIDIVPRLFDIVGPGIGFHTVEGLPMLGISPPRLSRSSRLLKRCLDVVVSAVGLVLLAPVLRGDRDRDQARLARAGVLPAGADGQAGPAVSGSGSSGRCRSTPRSGSPSSRT